MKPRSTPRDHSAAASSTTSTRGADTEVHLSTHPTQGRGVWRPKGWFGRWNGARRSTTHELGEKKVAGPRSDGQLCDEMARIASFVRLVASSSLLCVAACGADSIPAEGDGGGGGGNQPTGGAAGVQSPGGSGGG